MNFVRFCLFGFVCVCKCAFVFWVFLVILSPVPLGRGGVSEWLLSWLLSSRFWWPQGCSLTGELVLPNMVASQDARAIRVSIKLISCMLFPAEDVLS